MTIIAYSVGARFLTGFSPASSVPLGDEAGEGEGEGEGRGDSGEPAAGPGRAEPKV